MKQLPSLTVSELATAFSTSRDTVRARLNDAAVKPSGKRRGVDVYGLRVAAAALTSEATTAFQRKARLQAELLELELAKQRGELCELWDVEARFASVFKTVANFFDVIPDVLERDGGLSTVQLELVERLIDELRERLYQQLMRTDHGNRPANDQKAQRRRKTGDGRNPGRSRC